MKTSWNLGLLYNSHDDPRIERDIRAGERAFAAFEKKYKGKADYLKNETKLLAALTEFEGMFKRLTAAGPIMYFHYVTDLDSSDAVARSRSTQLSERYAKNDSASPSSSSPSARCRSRFRGSSSHQRSCRVFATI